MSRFRNSFASFACLSLLANLIARPALADPRAEAGAQSALEKAQADFSSEKYRAASARMRKALATCGAKRCSATTKATLLRDIGTMQFRVGDKAGAAKTWARALSLESTLALNPAYETPDLRSAWEAARSSAGLPPPSPTPPAASAETPSEASPGAAGTPATASEPAPPPAPAPAAEEPKKGEPEAAGAPPGAQAAAASGNGEAEPKEERRHYAHVWIGVAGALDLLILPSDSNTCQLTATNAPVSANHYRCFDPVNRVDVPGNQAGNAVLAAGQTGSASSSLQVGDVRAMVSLDYALLEHALLGVRAGYVLNTYPGTAGKAFSVPLHLEGRVTLLAGHAPLSSGAFAPMLFAGGGVSEFDGKQTTAVGRTDTRMTVPVDAWISEGPAFVTLGAGFREQFSAHAAVTGAVRVNMVLDSGAVPTYGPELGIQFGL